MSAHTSLKTRIEQSLTDQPIDLRAIGSIIWDELTAAVDNGRHPWHLAIFATSAGDGPAARTVVLRSVNGELRQLLFHTDVRSPKVDQLKLHPRCAWLFYDPAAKIQLRLSGECTVHTNDEVADELWEQAELSSRRCYLAPDAPGQSLSDPSHNLPEGMESRLPTSAEVEAGRENFAAIVTEIDHVDWVYLREGGNLRAQWRWTNDDWEAEWLAP